MKGKHSKQPVRILLRYYWEQVKKDWKISIPALLLPGIGSILVIYVPPLIIADILSSLQAGTFEFDQASTYLLQIGVVWLTGEMLWRIAIYFLIRLEARSEERLFNLAMEKMFKRPMAFFSDNFAGSLTKKTIGFARNFTSIADAFAMNIITNLFPLIFISIVLWTFSPLIVLALYVVVAFLALVVLPLIKRRQKLVDIREIASNKLSGRIADIYTNMESIKTFAHEDFELNTYGDIVNDFEKKQEKSWHYQNSRIDMLVSPMYVLVNITGLFLALMLINRGVANVDVIFLVFSYFTTYTRVMWEFNFIYRRLESHISDAAQFTKLLEEKLTVTDVDNPKVLQVNKGQIEFKDVFFQYHTKNRDILFEGLSLKIEPGQKVGLVGPSGGGKTTITKLLHRFMDIQDGKIMIDCQDISQVPQRDLRNAIAYVPQEPVLFHRSIAENIRYGNPDAPDEEVIKAAKLAHAHEFIKDLPDGYDTLVGERGMKLSGGQKQRVAIARAILVDARILVMDEATSALDSKSEQYIQDALETLMQDHTTLVIAHRLSTIKKLDRIIVMKEGTVVEDGTHSELLAQKGIYHELWSHQSGDFID